VPVNADGRWRSLFEALALPSADVASLANLFPWLRDLPPRVLAHLEAEALYAPYLARHASERALLAREEALAIPPDLEAIVLKALDKDRARRYESPNQLAADVGRHLAGEAVVAEPPRW